MSISESTRKAVELLKQLIATPSVSRDESAAANIIEQYLQHSGCNPQRHGNNVWAVSPKWDAQRPTVLLDAHIDTVRPTNAWTRNPFSPTIEGDRLYGLGANDDGGSLVCLIHVFLDLIANPMPCQPNMVMLASCEEEVAGKGGIESVLPLLPHIDYAIVGEPTGMQPAVAEKGLMVIDVCAHGVAGHAARDEGVNAIYKAIDDIEWVRNHRFERVSPLLGPVKATVTIIEAGTVHNVVPAQCHFTIDVRSNELYTNQELFGEISEHLDGTATARSFRLSSTSIDTNHPIVQRALNLGLKPYGSPTLSNRALLTMPAVKIGPGESARSHTSDEFICISEIEQAIHIYKQLICIPQ